ncbi:hypothetical protein [Microbacterium sp. NPDC055665]
MTSFSPSSPAGEDGAAPQPSPFPVGDLDFVLRNHARLIDDHTGALQAQGESLDAIIAHLSGQPGGPWQWEHLDRVQAQRLWGELVAFMDFLDRRYLCYLGGQGAKIVTDWYKHPVLVELFTALMVAYQSVYSTSSRVPSFGLVEWHERCLWPTFDRIERLRLFQGSTDQDAWDGPGALPLHNKAPERFATFLDEDLAWRDKPKPAPSKASPATPPPRAARPAPSSTGADHPASSTISNTVDDDRAFLPSDDDAPPIDDAPPPPVDRE